MTSDEQWMALALEEAEKAGDVGEVPVGAVIIYKDKVIARAGNRKESTQDPLGHAEILAIRQAAEFRQAWRLIGCTLYVTLEPCAMCAGAIVNARVDRVVFGTTDPRAGAAGSALNVLQNEQLNHRPEVTSGVCSDKAAKILTDFFSKRRKES